MAEVLRWAGDCLRAFVGLVFMLIPGIVFWLVVLGIIAIAQQWNHAGPCQIVWDKIREGLKAVARKAPESTK